MVATYTIFGRQVGSHVASSGLFPPGAKSRQLTVRKLAMITLGATGLGSWYGLRGGDKKPESKPPINAGSSDEEKFIKYVKDAIVGAKLTLGWQRFLTDQFRFVKGSCEGCVVDCQIKRRLGIVYYGIDVHANLARSCAFSIS